LPAGVVSVKGSFDVDAAVEVTGEDGVVFAKGLVRHGAERIRSWAGRRSSELPDDAAYEVVHRDDLVILV
jgi:glutamate 5-kinase